MIYYPTWHITKVENMTFEEKLRNDVNKEISRIEVYLEELRQFKKVISHPKIKKRNNKIKTFTPEIISENKYFERSTKPMYIENIYTV